MARESHRWHKLVDLNAEGEITTSEWESPKAQLAFLSSSVAAAAVALAQIIAG